MLRKITKAFVCLSLISGFLSSSQKAQAFVFEDRISVAKSLAHYAMGQVYDLLGQTKRSIIEYENAAQFDQQSYLIHLRLGANYARLDMLSKAKDELQLVNQYNPEDLQSHYLLALIYSTEKDFDKAAGEYEHILKTFSKAEPANVDIYGYLGQLYYSQKKYQQAIEQFEKMVSLDPKNPDVMYLLGSLYIEIKNNDRAIELLKNALDVDPDHDGSLNTLAYLYADSDSNLKVAEEYIEKALKLSPDNGAYLDTLGWVYYKKGKFDKALEALLKADSFLKDPAIYEHLGDVYFKLNKFDDAKKYWELSLSLLSNLEVIQKLENLNSIQARNKESIPTK